MKTALALIASTFLCLSFPSRAHAERLVDIANIEGVRQNQLMGYGLVVGLDGSGDQTTQTPFTVQSIVSMLQQMGVSLPPGTGLQLKNVAAVVVTASLPPFAQPGQVVDVTVSSVGNAKSLKGGTLLMTPLKGADGQVYAMAQGSMIVAGAGRSAPGATAQPSHLSAGRITGGATVEKLAPSPLGAAGTINVELNESSFSTSRKVADAINKKFGAGTASAQDGRVIRVKTPVGNDLRVAFLGDLEDIEVNPSQGAPKIIINARTGSIVMSQGVSLEPCAVSHGNLSVIVNSETATAQLGPDGKAIIIQNSQINVQQAPGALNMLKAGASLSEVVKALNAIGANPQDLLAILQAMKSSGALKADLEII
jgi:flagellar P-ring protein precursor FlgI